MALWSKKKAETNRVLEFNTNKLNEELQNLSSKLFEFKNDTGFVIVEEILEMLFNVQVLKLGAMKDKESLSFSQGKLQAYRDLAAYLERAKSTKPETEKSSKPKYAMRARQVDNQAGASI